MERDEGLKLAFCPLFSGSSGNAVFIGSQQARVLVDAGVSATAICQALVEIDVHPDQLDGILVTHEHTDHTRALQTLARKYGIPIYANRATFDALGKKTEAIPAGLARVFETGQEFYIGNLAVRSFSIPHDAADPVGFAVHANGKKACVMTDLGHVPTRLLDQAAQADVMLLESNHDVHLLEQGKYPAYLKRRILSTKGHLSNETAGHTAVRLAQRGVKRFFLGHLSQENNREDVALSAVCGALTAQQIQPGRDVALAMAHRNCRSTLVVLDR